VKEAQDDKRRAHESRRFSRRALMELAAASLLVSCQPIKASPAPTAEPPPPPTNTPIPSAASPTSTPTATPEPAPAGTSTFTPESEPSEPPSRDEIMRIYPSTPSKVVRTHHSAVWSAGRLAPETLSQMLDAGISQLTGLDSAEAAWSTLFSPHELIAIKVNTIGNSNYWSHVPLVLAVTEKLKAIGVPAEQIVIFDRYTPELDGAGYPTNKDAPGIRCFGTDNHLTGGWQLDGKDLALSDILLECDALINMPILKNHGMSGLSFAMKNYYGTINQPSRFHDNIGICIAELNALAPIRERTRLIIGDELAIVQKSWKSAYPGNSILMSFDPVAHDLAGVQLYEQTAGGGESAAVKGLSEGWLAHGAELGLGTNDPDNMDLMEVDLS